MKFLIYILIIVAIIFLWIITIYNKLIRLIEAINNNKKQIDIQLDRRFKVYESLIEVVKKYMDYEQTTLKDVVALRNQAQKAASQGDEKARIAAEEGISKISSGLNLVFERYPDLKANQNALQLQEEIVSTENKLTYAKQAYNDSVERYEATRKSFFQAIVVGMFSGKLMKQFVYWGLSDQEIQKQEQYKVKF
jgi:LemA protein